MKRLVIERIPKAPDVEVHVSTVSVDGLVLVDIRDYIRSKRRYGRGIMLPCTDAVLGRLMSALEEVEGE